MSETFSYATDGTLVTITSSRGGEELTLDFDSCVEAIATIEDRRSLYESDDAYIKAVVMYQMALYMFDVEEE